MGLYPELVQKAIEELSKLPGIGQKSAERIVFYLLDQPKSEAKRLASSIFYMREKIHFCQRCNNFAQSDLCEVCSDPTRDRTILCVVEKPSDVTVIEKAGYYRGTYYVLLGTISPTEEDKRSLPLNKLSSLLQREPVQEVIIATDADAEGEITALYLRDFLGKYPVRVSRIGMGIPVGANLEYMDSVTIAKAIEMRKLY